MAVSLCLMQQLAANDAILQQWQVPKYNISLDKINDWFLEQNKQQLAIVLSLEITYYIHLSYASKAGFR